MIVLNRKSFIILLIFIFIIFAVVPSYLTSSPTSNNSAPESNMVTIFFTGNELGELKPCGCSGGQLGGLEKRSAIFSQIPVANRLIVDTGNLVKDDGEQDVIKMGILIEAYRLLRYDLLCFSKEDLEMAIAPAMVTGVDTGYKIIADDSSMFSQFEKKFSKVFNIDGQTIEVRIVTFNSEGSSIRQLPLTFGDSSAAKTLDILLVDKSDEQFLQSVKDTYPSIDCIICPAPTDEITLISQTESVPIIFTVGQKGRHICRLDINPAGRFEDGLRAKTVAQVDRLSLRLCSVNVVEELEPNQALDKLYKNYQLLVKDADLLSKDKYQRFPLPDDDNKYIGSGDWCASCHAYEFEIWSNFLHSCAFQTLVDEGVQYDPDCVICHVVGLDYETGFVSRAETPGMINVGCEVCHGPAYLHAISGGRIPTTGPKMTCLDCHTPEHSAEYAGNEDLFLRKMRHWVEQEGDSDVK